MNLEKLTQIVEAHLQKRGEKKRVCVCAGAGCVSTGSLATLEAFKKAVKDKGLESDVEVLPTGCMGACNQGPLVEITPDDNVYQKVGAPDAAVVVDKHLLHHSVVPSLLLFSEPGKPAASEKASRLP